MKKLRIHCFQHVAFEGLGCIQKWIDRNLHELTYTRFFDGDSIPKSEDYDWLIVMGGPMGIYDKEYAWLEPEKVAIKHAVDSGKTVLGICLGSQLIADVLGSKVFRNSEKEIGWFNIYPTDQALSNNLLSDISKEGLVVFHWHGDTFNIPANAEYLAFSKCCKSQAFAFNKKVIGLQFHLEVTFESLRSMLENAGDELILAPFVQSEKEILSQTERIDKNNELMFVLLDKLSFL
jgi:GMP synthase-like glutamine amidotransferase